MQYFREAIPAPAAVTVIGGVAFVVLLAVGVVRADDALPDAMTILDRAEAALGDAKKIAAIKTVVYSGTVDTMGMKGSFVESYARPMKALTVTEFPAMGKISDGTDGTVFWEDNGPQGVAIHEGNPKVLKEHGYAARLSIPWRQIYTGFELEGIEDVDGRDCYKMRLLADGTLPEICYIDCETYRPTRVELTLLEPSMGNQKLPIQITYSDWKQVDGIWYAHTHTIGLNRMQIVKRYEKIEHDVKLDDKVFALPVNVKAKLAK